MSRPPYKLLSLLLQYPDEELLEARPDLLAAITSLSRSRERRELEAFWRWFGERPATELQQAYVETFDLQKRSSLYLTFFTEGDTRKRGQALLRLKRLYAAGGLELEARELPDHLPVMLEFAAFAPGDAGRRLLAEHRPALELLRRHLAEAASPYSHLLEALCHALPRPAAADLARADRLEAEGPPLELVGLQP